jgi:3-deoxy-D-manno-octulosonic-acid transferase
MFPPVSRLQYVAKARCYAPVTFVKRVVFGTDPYWRQWFWSRWGFVPEGAGGSGSPVIWVEAHGGEITQMPTISQMLREEFPRCRLVVSTNNRYAFDFAIRRLSVEAVFDTPWDLAGPMRRALRRVRPSAIIFIENVKYPILVRLAARHRIPTILLSGFISKGWTEHPYIRSCVKLGAYRNLTAVGARSPEDARAFQELGIRNERPAVTGNLKCDPEALRLTAQERQALLETLGWRPEDPIFVAGGIRSDEYDAVASAFESAARARPDLKLIAAPSYDHQIQLEQLITVIGPGAARLSDVLNGRARGSSPRAVVVDTFGDLPRLYGLASVAFVGSLSHGGTGLGHNLMEPLVHGVPTLVGPYVDRWEHLVNRLRQVWSGIQCRDGRGLADSLQALLQDPALERTLREEISKLITEYAGAVQATRTFLRQSLSTLGPRGS